MALNQARQMSENTLDVDEYLNEPSENSDDDPIVQLITETAPYPHAALRIGHKVYNYGLQFVTSRNFKEYFSQPQPDPGEFNRDDASLPRNLVNRSMRVTDLYLEPSYVAKLQRELEMNTGKEYQNETMINDCATMLKRALAGPGGVDFPTVIDPFPSLESTYLSLRHTLGDKRIGPTRMLVMGKDAKKGFHLARNTYLAIMEGKVALALLPMNALSRGVLDYSEDKAKLQSHPPEIQEKIDSWKKETREKVREQIFQLLKGKDFFARLARIESREARSRQASHARGVITGVISGEIELEQRILDFSGSEMRQVIEATDRVSALEAIQEELLRKLEEGST
jgi:hypothetical protein